MVPRPLTCEVPKASICLVVITATTAVFNAANAGALKAATCIVVSLTTWTLFKLRIALVFKLLILKPDRAPICAVVKYCTSLDFKLGSWSIVRAPNWVGFNARSWLLLKTAILPALNAATSFVSSAAICLVVKALIVCVFRAFTCKVESATIWPGVKAEIAFVFNEAKALVLNPGIWFTVNATIWVVLIANKTFVFSWLMLPPANCCHWVTESWPRVVEVRVESWAVLSALICLELKPCNWVLLKFWIELEVKNATSVVFNAPIWVRDKDLKKDEEMAWTCWVVKEAIWVALRDKTALVFIAFNPLEFKPAIWVVVNTATCVPLKAPILSELSVLSLDAVISGIWYCVKSLKLVVLKSCNWLDVSAPICLADSERSCVLLSASKLLACITAISLVSNAPTCLAVKAWMKLEPRS